MAPFHEQVHLAKGVKVYMALIAENKSLRFDKQLVGSEEFKKFLYHLSKRAPSALDKLLQKVSRKCAEVLRKERQAGREKKRAASANCEGRNIKRHRTSYTVVEETLLPAGTNGEKAPVESEDPSPQSNAYFNGTVLPRTLVSDIGGECTSETSFVPTSHEIESGLMTRSPVIEAYVKASLVALKPSIERANFNIDNEIAKVWKIVPFLEFYKTRHELKQHLKNREKTPDEKLYSRAIWSSSDPSEILDILENVRMSSLDNKIHRAYGQTILVLSVDAQAAGECKNITSHRSGHMKIFEELACKKAGPVSNAELAQIASSYFYEYQSGQKWLAVIDWFGGSGIILIFIIAGIGTWFMKSWTEFHRSCVQHIAGLLHSIRRLVETLGSDALERYCRYGRLGNNCLDRLRSATFTKPDTNEESGLMDAEIEDAGEEYGEEAGSGGDWWRF